jgi:hypothetical protein
MIERYERKPDPPRHVLAARYTPGGPVADLAAVAAMAGGDILEATFPGQRQPLLIALWAYDDGDGWDTEVIRPGYYLAFTPGTGLWECDDATLRRRFVKEEGSAG